MFGSNKGVADVNEAAEESVVLCEGVAATLDSAAVPAAEPAAVSLVELVPEIPVAPVAVLSVVENATLVSASG
jgi:hypothetical protein